MRTPSIARPLVASLAALAALAPAAARGGEPRKPPAQAILVYGKVGALVPVGKLSPHVTFHLGGGYLLPVLKRRLAAIVDVGFSQTSADKSVADPRVGQAAADASYSYTLRQRDLDLFIGPQVYILDPYRRFVPFAAVGAHLHFLQSLVEGAGGGQALGENTETSTKAGFAVRLGAGYRLGLGLLTGEVDISWAPIDHDITGSSHLGRVSILFGYTAMLGF